jgi:hypothetical protein
VDARQDEPAEVVVDAAVIAEGFGLDPAGVVERLRDGSITGICERGIDADRGTYRLTFRSGGRVMQVVVDEAGRVLDR